MQLRSWLGSLQLPVAGVGVALVVFAAGSIATIPEPPAGSDGFVGGLAVVFLSLIGWAGLVVAPLGLAIPPSGGYGVRFNRYQRGLFVASSAGWFLAGVIPLLGFGLLLRQPDLMVSSLLALATAATLSLVAGLCWRGGEAIGRRVGGLDAFGG